MDPTDIGYQALREGAAWLDLTGRAVIRAAGEDRIRLLHAMTTNHIEQLEPGQGCYAFFLNAQGRILADVNVLRFPDYLLLETEPERREFVLEHVNKYIIADDVTLEDLTPGMAVLGLEGPNSAGVLTAAAAPAPEPPGSHAAWGTRFVARLSSTGAPGFRLFASAEEKQALIRVLEAAGAVAAGAEAARTVRLEIGRPRYGEDISEKYLPQETQLLHAVHFAKGCYLGQEIVERVRSRGMVHRFLVRLSIDSPLPPGPGAKINAGAKEVGEITSAAFSPAAGKVLALGYVRLGEIGAGAGLMVEGQPAEIIARKPAE